ncbi:hypothetical protein ABIA39_006574 [Nocardia sp. GAS34]|uniref:competence protein CoiA family protein n=1 Tax=unclassified Nocardia TaxID=2637762 RepID=UPI003D1BB971
MRQLRAKGYSGDRSLVCALCYAGVDATSGAIVPVVVRGRIGGDRRPQFAHPPRLGPTGGLHAPESVWHLASKAILTAWARTQPGVIEVRNEVWLPHCQRRCDVRVYWTATIRSNGQLCRCQHTPTKNLAPERDRDSSGRLMPDRCAVRRSADSAHQRQSHRPFTNCSTGKPTSVGGMRVPRQCSTPGVTVVPELSFTRRAQYCNNFRRTVSSSAARQYSSDITVHIPDLFKFSGGNALSPGEGKPTTMGPPEDGAMSRFGTALAVWRCEYGLCTVGDTLISPAGSGNALNCRGFGFTDSTTDSGPTNGGGENPGHTWHSGALMDHEAGNRASPE